MCYSRFVAMRFSSTPGILMVSLPPSSKLKRRAGSFSSVKSTRLRNPSGTTPDGELPMPSTLQARFGETEYSLGRFVLERAKALGLTRTDLVRRLGYENLNAG